MASGSRANPRRVWTPWLAPHIAHTPLCARMIRYLESLFAFVIEPTVPATNDAAERSLQPPVVSRVFDILGG